MIRIINKLKSRKGFTLIELIVVLAVLAIIMAIAVPRFLGVQESARKGGDATTASMIAEAAELYVVSENIATPIADDDLDSTVTLALLMANGEYMETGTSFQYYTGDVVITLNAQGECTNVSVGGKTLFPRPTTLPDL